MSGTVVDAVLMGVPGVWDVWATERCISNGTCGELHPLAQSRGARLALKIGMFPVKVGGSYWLRRQGRHGLARWMAIGAGVVDLGAGTRNFVLWRRKPDAR